MSGYRDEDEAAALKAENEALKQQKTTKPPKREAALASQPRGTWQPPRTPGGAIAFTFVASVVLVGIHGTVCVLRGFPPGVGLGILSFVAGGGGAIAVASTGYYALYPSAKIVARDPHSNEPYEVERSPERRRLLAFISLGAYAMGLVLTFLFGRP